MVALGVGPGLRASVCGQDRSQGQRKANIQGMQSKTRLRRAARDWSIREKGRGVFQNREGTQLCQKLDKKALGGLTVNSPETRMVEPAPRGEGQGLGRAYLHRWTDFVGASWHRSRLGKPAAVRGGHRGP